MKLKHVAVVCLSASLLLSPGAAIASRPPQMDVNGDWVAPSRYRDWRVSDPDPNGLNCRMRGNFQDILGDRYRNINPNILSMPVVATLPYNSTFVAGTTPAGNVLINDNRGLPWIYNQDDNCFVRANEDYVIPRVVFTRQLQPKFD